jgi:hypothetical protein
MTPEEELAFQEQLRMNDMVNWKVGKDREDARPKAQPKPNLQTRPDSLAKLFEVAASLPRAESIQYLRRNRHAAILQIGRYILDPDIVFAVQVPADFQPSIKADQSLSLYQEAARRLYIFATDPQRPSPLANDPQKRQRRFEDMLASLLADEAALLTQIVQKKLPLDVALLVEAFPELQQYKTLNVNTPSTKAADHFRHEMKQAHVELEDTNRRLDDAEDLMNALHAKKNQILQRIHRATEQLGNITTGGNRYSV